MGLIDAEALKEYCMHASKSDDDFRRVSLATLASVIDAQPTAYDPDKVVQQLKDRSTLSRPVGWTKSYEIITLKDAVEIVKGGRVDGN